ncbi:hypothetical protein DIPPA_12964, partial [Diplonema papillatum]
ENVVTRALNAFQVSGADKVECDGEVWDSGDDQRLVADIGLTAASVVTLWNDKPRLDQLDDVPNFHHQGTA